MSYDPENKVAMSLKDFGDKLIYEFIEPLIESNPYLSFMVLSASIEFIGKCRNKKKNPHANKSGDNMFVFAIDNINALSSYRIFNYNTGGNRHSNKLYKALRCGLLHAAMPDVDIVLSSNTNELGRNTVGCKSLYDDIKNAWEEIKGIADVEEYLNKTKAIVISQQHPDDI